MSPPPDWLDVVIGETLEGGFAEMPDVLREAANATVAAIGLTLVSPKCASSPLEDTPLYDDLRDAVLELAQKALEGGGPTNHPDPNSEDPFIVNEARLLTSDPAYPRLTIEQGALLVDALVTAVCLDDPRVLSVVEGLRARNAPALLTHLSRKLKALTRVLPSVEDPRAGLASGVIGLSA